MISTASVQGVHQGTTGRVVRLLAALQVRGAGRGADEAPRGSHALRPPEATQDPERTHAGGTRALPARPPGPLSCHTGPEPSVLSVGPLRHGKAASGDHLWLRRIHDSKVSGMSMPRRIAIFP